MKKQEFFDLINLHWAELDTWMLPNGLEDAFLPILMKHGRPPHHQNSTILAILIDIYKEMEYYE